MILGLPTISSTKDVCEGCVLGKHHKEMFDKGKAWHYDVFFSNKATISLLSYIDYVWVGDNTYISSIAYVFHLLAWFRCNLMIIKKRLVHFLVLL